MKSPLHYQISEYDCGPTSMLNAINFLFEREAIPPEIIRNIMLYSLDCYGAEGAPGKNGTSSMAMMFLASWLGGFGRLGQLPLSSRYLSGAEVCVGADSPLNDALRRHGAVVVRLYYDVAHYVLLTEEVPGGLRLFDPYYQTEGFTQAPDIEVTLAHPCHYNRTVPERYFNRPTQDLFALGPPAEREAVLLFNDTTKLTEDKTIEYFI